jgi:hypothetical protein
MNWSPAAPRAARFVAVPADDGKQYVEMPLICSCGICNKEGRQESGG